MFYSSLFGQDYKGNALDSFSVKFDSIIRNHEKQRAYLVTDKSVFRAGETIWFNAFLLNNFSQNKYPKSRFLFVDLVGEKDSVFNTVILDAANKQLNSRFVLTNSMASGYYWIRAYTRQMTQDNADGMYIQPIYIFSKTADINTPVVKKRINNQNNIPELAFYPEGNCIITGLNSTVALGISQANGEPVITSGYVKDNRDTVVAQFITNSNGLGKFVFEPSGFRKYKAVINWQGKEISYPLPSFNFYGGQLSVTKETEGYKIRVLLGDSIYRKDAVTYVIGVSKDSLIFGSIGKGQYEMLVDGKKLAEGITTFYLFNKDFKLLSERSVYLHDNNLQIKLSTDKELYAPREKVSLNISITDMHQRPVPSHIAIAVADTLLSVPDAPIFPGGTECPQKAIDNFFLALNESVMDENIDLMMLVKNNTYQTLTGILPGLPGADADSLLFIRGTVLNKKNEPSAGKIVTLLSKSSDLFFHADTTDNKGRFRFPLEGYADSTEFVMEVKSVNGGTRDKNNSIVPDPLNYPKIKTPLCMKQYLPIQTLLARKYYKVYPADELMEGGGKSLLPVTLKSKVRPINYDQSKRVSQSSTILTSDDINERAGVKTAVLMVGGLQVINGFLVMHGPTDIARGVTAGSEPLLLENGVEVHNSGVSDLEGNSFILGYLDRLNPRDIDFIEILKGPDASAFGLRGGNGAILINTLTEQKDFKTGKDGITFYYAKGISNPVTFPNLSYDKKNKKTAALTDSRSTLFWNGNYLTGETQNSTFTFYTNDIASTYRVTVTGVTLHGDIIYKTITFQNK